MTDDGESEFRRIFSVRGTVTRVGGCISSMLEVFGIWKTFSIEIPPRATIHDLDTQAFSNKNSEQQRINNTLKEEKMDIWWAIGSSFHFNDIPTNAVGKTYFQFVVPPIQAVDPCVDLSGSKDIHGELLHNNKEKLQKWTTSYQASSLYIWTNVDVWWLV